VPDLDRAELLDLLGRLGAEDDATVLAAARALHRKVSETSLSWDEVLRLDARPDDAGADADGPEEAFEEPEQSAAPVATGGKAEVVRLIDRLLARPSISQTLRAELGDFKRAIAEGTFEQEDAQYVRALARRLGVS
jgi:hypothetical protein